MSINPRRKKHFKRKIVVLILILGILGYVVFSYNTFFLFGRTPFISPINNVNPRGYVEKILKKYNIAFSSLISSDDSYLINIKDNGQVRISQSKNIDKQISSLQRILIQLTIEGKLFKSIDFRFSEPIISF
jgi:hypothetical protein